MGEKLAKVTVSRRAFIGGLFAVPAIVSAHNLMPISSSWRLLSEVRVGREFTPWVVRYWSQNGIIRSEIETLWYGRRTPDLAALSEKDR